MKAPLSSHAEPRTTCSQGINGTFKADRDLKQEAATEKTPRAGRVTVETDYSGWPTIRESSQRVFGRLGWLRRIGLWVRDRGGADV